MDWKFENTKNDSSGNGYTATSASSTYTSTPNQTLVYGTVYQPDAPAVLTYARAARVGVAESLSCANSFSWLQSSAAVTCDWAATPQNSQTCTFDDATSNPTPTLTSSAFGECTVTLTATDTTAVTATATYHLGAVPATSNGVVTHADANVGKIFGPIMAYGYSPWQYMDYQDAAMAVAQASRIAAISPPTWATWKTGTISWRKRSTTMASTATVGDATITVTDATQFDNTTFPMILTNDVYNGFLLRVCSKGSGGTANVYTVCSSGWGWDSTTPINLSGSIYQLKATGSGTAFLTDLCTGGAAVHTSNLIAVEWSHPNIPTGGASPLVSSSLEGSHVDCESDTEAYFIGLLNAVDGSIETGVHYAVSQGTWVGEQGISYYDTGEAMAAYYYRTGLKSALDAWRLLAVYWPWQPAIQGGYNTNPPRDQSMQSVFASAALDSAQHSAYIWPLLRTWVAQGDLSAYPCYSDLREGAYVGIWAALGAMLDPDSGNRATAAALVAGNYTRDNTCKGASNNAPSVQFPTSDLVSGYVYQSGLTVTNGSAIVTGSGIPSSFCPSIQVTATLTNGSATMHRTSGSAWQTDTSYIAIVRGARADGGAFESRYAWTSGDDATLPYVFEGTTASYTVDLFSTAAAPYYYMTIHDVSNTAFTDAGFGNIYSCTWNNSGQITLDRNWGSATITGTAAAGRYVQVGWGTQPFILSLKVQQYQYSYLSGKAEYLALRNSAAEWFRSTLNNTLIAPYYTRGSAMSEPPWQASINVGCLSCGGDTSYDAGEMRAGLGGEAFNSIAYWGPSHLTDADALFNALWGKSGYNVGAAGSAPAIQGWDCWTGSGGACVGNSTPLTSYKWPGFFFGVGMAHQWPAARLAQGGVSLFNTGTSNSVFK